MRKILLLIAVVMVMGLGTTWAQTLTDPEFLHIGTGVGTDCEAGGCYVFGNEVNGLGSASTIDVYYNSGGKTVLLSPVLLIIGVPDGGGTAPAITSGNGTLLGASYYGGVWPSDGSGVVWDPEVTTQTVYDALHLGGAGGSQQFEKWVAAESAVNGFTPESFTLYVYGLNLTGFGSDKAGVDVTFGGSGLPGGTFVVAYGCSALATDGSGNCQWNAKNPYTTPFTEGGLTGSQVPEPGTLTLLGSGLIGLAGLIRRRRNKA